MTAASPKAIQEAAALALEALRDLAEQDALEAA